MVCKITLVVTEIKIKMKTNLFIALILFIAISSYAQEKKPNILLISVDDLNDWVGVYGGNPQMKTPHIDKLASEAMVFRNTSCPGPSCCPSRSALLSGFMTATTGVYRNSQNMLHTKIVQENATMPEYFSKHGYVTISSGKIFHRHITTNGFDYGQWAFDVWKLATGDYEIREDNFFSRDKGIINGQKLKNQDPQGHYEPGDPKYTEFYKTLFEFGPTKGGKEETMDYRTARWFEEKLQENYDKPFFMFAGFSKPHIPWHVPKEFFDMYERDSIEVPEFRLDDLNDIVDENGKKIYSPEVDFLWCQHYDVHKDAVLAYMAAASYADECVGVVLDALKKSKYAENTIVILMGDHGWHLGEKLKFRKHTLWRESTQLPLIMHLPGMNEKQECFRNVNLIDLYPTLIDICHLPPKKLDGKSIKPLFENPELQWEPTLTTFQKGNHSVMAEKWHYIIRYGGEELYNLEEDPMEWNNLAHSNSDEIIKIKEYMKSYLPEYNEWELFKYRKDRSVTHLDESIKSKRDISKLK